MKLRNNLILLSSVLFFTGPLGPNSQVNAISTDSPLVNVLKKVPVFGKGRKKKTTVPTEKDEEEKYERESKKKRNMLREGTGLEKFIPGTVRFKEAKGVCETTPGVYQASGYVSLTQTEQMWFWLFEARENPESAPLAIWINGGPGSSSMVSLFDGNGPCRMTEDGKDVVHNPYSWNNKVNMLYIDQPIGVGFSYGRLLVGRTTEAAADMWTFLQMFLKHEKFSKYAGKELGIWTESYGGHFAPGFVTHFLHQNEEIEKGRLKGLKINMKVMGIGNGLTDPVNQYEGYLEYAKSNPYRPLADDTLLERAKKLFYRNGGCKSQIKLCQATNSETVCRAAQKYCNAYVWGPLSTKMVGNPYFVKDIAEKFGLPNIGFLASKEIKQQIAAKGDLEFAPANNLVYENFAETGDWMKNFVPHLRKAISSNVRTLLYNGDADYVVNYHGVESLIKNLPSRYNRQAIQDRLVAYIVNGTEAGKFHSVENFHYIRVFGAGHGVPAYGHGKLEKGQVAEKMFNQIMFGLPLSGIEDELAEGGKRRSVKPDL